MKSPLNLDTCLSILATQELHVMPVTCMTHLTGDDSDFRLSSTGIMTAAVDFVAIPELNAQLVSTYNQNMTPKIYLKQ